MTGDITRDMTVSIIDECDNHDTSYILSDSFLWDSDTLILLVLYESGGDDGPFYYLHNHRLFLLC